MQQRTFGQRNKPKTNQSTAQQPSKRDRENDLDHPALSVPGASSLWRSALVGTMVLAGGLAAGAVVILGFRTLLAEPALTILTSPPPTATASPQAPASSGCSASLDQFKALQVGITLQEANVRMGCPGIKSMETSLLGNTTTTYDWSIAGELKGTMSATFEGGRLTDKLYVEMRRR